MKLQIAKHDTVVSSFAFSPDGEILITGTAIGSVKIWNANNGTLLKHLIKPGWVIKSKITSIRFSASGEQFAVATANGDVKVWNTRDFSLAFVNHFSPQSKYKFTRNFVVLDRDAVTFVNSFDGTEIRRITAINAKFNFRGNKILDGLLNVYDENGNHLFRVSGARHKFSFDGSKILAISSARDRKKNIKIFNVTDSSLASMVETISTVAKVICSADNEKTFCSAYRWLVENFGCNDR